MGRSKRPTNYLWGPKKKWLKVSLKRSMSERDRDSEVIEVDNDITTPGAIRPTGLCHGQIDQEALS